MLEVKKNFLSRKKLIIIIEKKNRKNKKKNGANPLDFPKTSLYVKKFLIIGRGKYFLFFTQRNQLILKTGISCFGAINDTFALLLLDYIGATFVT